MFCTIVIVGSFGGDDTLVLSSAGFFFCFLLCVLFGVGKNVRCPAMCASSVLGRLSPERGLKVNGVFGPLVSGRRRAENAAQQYAFCGEHLHILFRNIPYFSPLEPVS